MAKRGRKPGSLVWLESKAVAMWYGVVLDESCGASAHWGDVSARLYGMGEACRGMKQEDASKEAFFLSSLAAHIHRGLFAVPSQGQIS